MWTKENKHGTSSCGEEGRKVKKPSQSVEDREFVLVTCVFRKLCRRVVPASTKRLSNGEGLLDLSKSVFSVCEFAAWNPTKFVSSEIGSFDLSVSVFVVCETSLYPTKRL